MSDDQLSRLVAVLSFGMPQAKVVISTRELWLFVALGHPAEVGLAVGLAVRLRELVWVTPGVVYLTGHAVRSSVRGLRPA